MCGGPSGFGFIRGGVRAGFDSARTWETYIDTSYGGRHREEDKEGRRGFAPTQSLPLPSPETPQPTTTGRQAYRCGPNLNALPRAGRPASTHLDSEKGRGGAHSVVICRGRDSLLNPESEHPLSPHCKVLKVECTNLFGVIVVICVVGLGAHHVAIADGRRLGE